MAVAPNKEPKPGVGLEHRLRRLRSRRRPGLQRSSLRTFVDKIERFELTLDPEDVGEAQEWYRPGQKNFEQLVEVGPIEQLPAYKPSANGKTVVWYHKTIYIPRREAGKHYKINFARACYSTKVWGNGRLLADVDGQTEHISGFSSFSYDLSEALDANGRIELIIRVENSDDPTICRGKQWSRQYARNGIWYNQASGLWGQVTLEEVNANRLRSDVTGYADPRTGLVRLQVITYITDAGQYTLDAAVDQPGKAGEVELVQYRQTLRLEPGQRTHELAFVVPTPRPWSPSQPSLYPVEISLRGEGNLLDRIYFDIGFRALEKRGSGLFLNDAPIYLDGVLYQPYHGDSYTLNYEQLLAELDYTRRVAGANLLRIHIAGADPLPLFIADKLGLLVWVEVPSPHISNEVSRANHRRELDSLLRQIDVHPCVAIISLYNESWGCQDIGAAGPEGQATRAYIEEMYRHVKSLRPDLLVVDNDGWEHLSRAGKLTATDLLSLHLYVNQSDKWQQDLAALPALVEPTNPRFPAVAGKPAVVGDPYSFGGELPFVISEWGGFGALYGGPQAEAEKFALLRQYKAALHTEGQKIAGDCYTQLGDVESETNGLLDKAQLRLRDPRFLAASAGLLGGLQAKAGENVPK